MDIVIYFNVIVSLYSTLNKTMASSLKLIMYLFVTHDCVPIITIWP